MARRDIAAAVQAQRESLDYAIDYEAMSPVVDFWDEEADQLIEVEQLKGQKGLDLDPAVIAALAAFLGIKVVDFSAKFAKALVASADKTMQESLRSLNEFIKKISGGKVTVLDDDEKTRRIIELRRAQLELMRQQTAASFGVQVNDKIRRTLMAAVPGEGKVVDLLDKIGDAVNEEWWKVERIVTTETAFAYNEAQADGMIELAKDPELQGLLMRWTERIDDAGRVLDKLVAPDSIAMHAQVAPPGGSFIMPPDAAERKVSYKMIGRSWQFPPNRPHDRAILTPWLPGSGQPAWIWRDGRRNLS